ncbi:MAG: hypothetical protein H6667_13080 [Ardenticatenaceae bacterium]|nr:hypothetical protein [Ardenticatenaceae bacterium]MCB9442678.1 hypothetical protein [Ardenticatenaceae bacterium]
MNRKVIYLTIVVMLFVSLLSAAIVFGQGSDPGQPTEPDVPVPAEPLEGDSNSTPLGSEPGQAGAGAGEIVDGATAVTGTAITYQGRLTEGGSPANGAFDFVFALYDAPVIASQVGITLTQVLTVSGGLFIADLDFGNVFDGAELYLQIGVRPEGSVTPYEILNPRQPLRPTPYALSLRPGADVISSVSNDAIFQTHNTAAIGTTSYALRGETDSASFSAAAIYGRVTSTTPGAYSAGVRGVNEGTLGNGIGVWGSQNGSGWGLYGSSVSGYGAFLTSSGSGGRGLYARGGTNTDADIVLGGSSTADDDGRIISDPNYSSSDIFLSSNDAVVVQLDVDAGTAEDADFSIEDRAANTIFNFDDGGEFAMFEPGVGEMVEILTTELGTDGAQITLRNNAGAATIILDAEYNAGGDGRITTEVLQITGGSDLSEQFDIAAAASTQPQAGVQPQAGYVVSIDLDNPGELVVSSQAYDRTVAGVISGAGGVKPGMLMGQTGSAADGRFPVALTGRVYVWVDAGYGAVQPGDLLTTSNTPGHAMVARDHDQAQGAILGKAMTALPRGCGLVLVLVALQ